MPCHVIAILWSVHMCRSNTTDLTVCQKRGKKAQQKEGERERKGERMKKKLPPFKGNLANPDAHWERVGGGGGGGWRGALGRRERSYRGREIDNPAQGGGQDRSVHGTSGEAARAVDASGPAPTPRVGLSFPHVQAGLHTVHGPLKRALDSPRPAATGNGPHCTFLARDSPIKMYA